MKQLQKGISLPSVIILVALVLGLFLVTKNWGPKQPETAGEIKTVADLDQASASLDQVDVDGLGNELGQMDADAASF